MSVKEQEIDSPIVFPQRILQEEEEITLPKQTLKIEEKQLEAFELAPKKTREKKEGSFDDSKLTLKKTREIKQKTFETLKQTPKKGHKQERQLEVLKQTPKKAKVEESKSQSPLQIGFDNSQPQKQIFSDSKAINNPYHYCHQKSMKQLIMKAKITIRQRSKAQKREQFLRNILAGQAIKSEDVQLEPHISQQSQDIILTQEQEKEYKKIQDSYKAMTKQIQAKKLTPQEILFYLPKLWKQYKFTFMNMKKLTKISAIGLIYNQAYKCQIEKELTQAQKKIYEKQLLAIDKIYQAINQKIDYYFPGERDSIYKNILPEKLYLIYKKYNQQKMSIKQKQDSVHILKMQ